MKTKNAFALRDWDASNILSRNYFLGLFGGQVPIDPFFDRQARNDEEFRMTGEEPQENDDDYIDLLVCSFPDIEEFSYTQGGLRYVADRVENYQKFIFRHDKRIAEYAKRLAEKIVEGRDDVEVLKSRYGRAKDLHQQYLRISDEVGDLQAKINSLLDKNLKMLERNYRKRFASNLRRYRTANSWSQRDLADRIGIAKTEISQYENGRKLPSVMTLVKLAQALEKSLDDLVKE